MITFIFKMCGQGCTTIFETEEEAWKWISICYDKGWLYPEELFVGYLPDVKHYDANQILDKLGE